MSDTPVEFWGKLYEGKAQRDLKNMEFSVADLKGMGSLKDKPIWLEHNAQTGDIGIIHKSWVDTSGWLWIHGELYGADRIGELHHEIRAKLVNGELPDLSIHWVGQADASTDIVDPDTKAVIEASLTTEGLFNGTTLYSVAANADSKTKTLHIGLPGQRLSLHPPTMSQDLQAIYEDAQKRYGVTLTDEEVRASAADPSGMNGALLTLKKLGEFADMKDGEIGAKEREIMEKVQMGESERADYEKLKAWKAEGEKQYAVDQNKVAEQLFGTVEKGLEKDRQTQVKERLSVLSSKSDYEPAWDMVKLFGQKATENEKLAADYAKQIAFGKKEHNNLLKDFQTLKSTQQGEQVEVSQAASSFSAKRGIDKDVDQNKRAKLDLEAGSKPVEQMASREASMANYFFGKTYGATANQHEFGAALDKLVSEQKLTIGEGPIVDWTHYRGNNQGPTPNRDGITPFGAH